MRDNDNDNEDIPPGQRCLSRPGPLSTGVGVGVGCMVVIVVYDRDAVRSVHA